MCIPVFRHEQIAALTYGICFVGVFFFVASSKAFATTPKSPEVIAAVKRGIEFLESDAANDSHLGGKALQGYSLLIYGAEPTHPKIVAAAEAIRQALGTRNPTKLDANAFDIYSTGLSIIFLVKLDKVKYHDDIECLLKSLRLRQKPHGGWGYPAVASGDTSMTQYGALGSWVAIQNGFDVPIESIEAVAMWLMRTQDPSGGFGYQGQVATGNELIAQSEVRSSMTAAGSGSLYICASLLGLIDAQEKRENLPSALKEIKKKDAKERIKTRIELRLVRETEERTKKWMEENDTLNSTTPWVHYYLYALERCMSFREIFDHESEKEPLWYNKGAKFLMKNQGADGSWAGQCGQVPDTAFAVLFLMRSTKRTLEKALSFGEGTMVGGRGIPTDTSRLTVQGGQLKSQLLLGPAEKLLEALDKPDDRDFDKTVELLAELPADKVEALAAKYGQKFRQLVGNQSAAARLAAVRALGKTRDLDNVETLIYALTDPDPIVVHAANDGLLRIRRAPFATALPENFSEEDRHLLVDKWKTWYQSIRPSAEMDR